MNSGSSGAAPSSLSPRSSKGRDGKRMGSSHWRNGLDGSQAADSVEFSRFQIVRSTRPLSIFNLRRVSLRNKALGVKLSRPFVFKGLRAECKTLASSTRLRQAASYVAPGNQSERDDCWRAEDDTGGSQQG